MTRPARAAPPGAPRSTRWSRRTRTVLAAALLAGCGVKAPPRPPEKAGARAAPPAAAAPATCETCAPGAPAPSTARTP
jgi:hypothetical protein